jgi:hypothetical protein
MSIENKIDDYLLENDTFYIKEDIYELLELEVCCLEEAKKKWPKKQVKNPGILEVPEGKTVSEMPASYFIGLAKKKGRGAIVKALMNLYRWNKNKNPKLSAWAKKTQEAVSASFEAAPA